MTILDLGVFNALLKDTGPRFLNSNKAESNPAVCPNTRHMLPLENGAISGRIKVQEFTLLLSISLAPGMGIVCEVGGTGK